MQEFFESLHERKTELQEACGTATDQGLTKLYDQIAAIDRVLSSEELAGPMVTGDDLVDDWEQMLDRGDAPDLEAGLDPEILKRFQ